MFPPPPPPLQSVLNQYSFCEDSQRKEFLDALFTLLEKEGAPRGCEGVRVCAVSTGNEMPESLLQHFILVVS